MYGPNMEANMASRTDQAIALIKELLEQQEKMQAKLEEMNKTIERMQGLVDELDNKL
jgi:hypothetical protein